MSITRWLSKEVLSKAIRWLCKVGVVLHGTHSFSTFIHDMAHVVAVVTLLIVVSSNIVVELVRTIIWDKVVAIVVETLIWPSVASLILGLWLSIKVLGLDWSPVGILALGKIRWILVCSLRRIVILVYVRALIGLWDGNEVRICGYDFDRGGVLEGLFVS